MGFSYTLGEKIFRTDGSGVEQFSTGIASK